MRVSRLFLSAQLLMLLAGYSLTTLAAPETIKVTSIAEMEIISKGITQRVPPTKAVPGTEVIFTNTFENIGKKAAGNIVINNPLPANTTYKAGSAFGQDCSTVFSADGAKTFATPENLKVKGADGKESIAQAAQYTHIRWTCPGQLAAGKSGEVGFRAVIK